MIFRPKRLREKALKAGSALPPWAKTRAMSIGLGAGIRIPAYARGRRVHRASQVYFTALETAEFRRGAVAGPGPRDVLVRALHTAVSTGTEVAEFQGLRRVLYPHRPGYSGSGVVMRGGGGEHGLAPGEVVAGSLRHGGLSRVAADRLFPVPPGVEPAAAALVVLGIMASHGVSLGGVREGMRVTVVGQGVIGQLAVRLAQLATGAGVTVVSRLGTRDSPASRHLRPQEVEANEADVVIEASGAPGALVFSCRHARPGGTVVLLGSQRTPEVDFDFYGQLQEKELRLIGAHVGRLDLTSWRAHGHSFLTHLAEGILHVGPLTACREDPADANHVYEALAAASLRPPGLLFEW